MVTIVHRRKKEFDNKAIELEIEVQEKEDYLFYIIYSKRKLTELHIIYKDEKINSEKHRLNKIERKKYVNK